MALMVVSFPALAETNDPVFLLEQNESLLHISATEQRQVDQDLLIASLRIEVESADNKKVQNDVNTAMTKALEMAKKYPDVKAITRGYNVYQYDKNAGKKDRPALVVWKGQQSVELKSKNAEKLLELAGKIQEAGFVMGGLNYTLSPEVAAQVQDEMLEAALEKLQNRAQRAAKSLGKSKAELKEINTEGGGYMPQPVYARAEMMSMDAGAKMAAPVASPGETTLSMTVNARAILKP
jgi:predicted secreted protein